MKIAVQQLAKYRCLWIRAFRYHGDLLPMRLMDSIFMMRDQLSHPLTYALKGLSGSEKIQNDSIDTVIVVA